MATAQFRLYFNNAPAGPERLALFTEIRIDQGIGVAAEAQLDLPIGTDAAGRWSGIEEDDLQAFTRIRIEVKVADDGFMPLIDGVVVGSRYEMSSAPDQSVMTLIVQDDSVLLNRDDKRAVYEEMAVRDIVSALFAGAGLQADADPAPGGAGPRVLVQRGTDMQLLRELAKRYGMFVYVRPGPLPGTSIGMFKAPRFESGALPAIVLVGEQRNVASFSAQFDALRPVRVQASSADSAAVAALGEVAAHAFTQPALAMLSGAREDQNELDAAAAAVASRSSWAYSANGELDTDSYPGVLQPYEVVSVRGVGGYLSGDYLIGHVMHVLNASSYRQRFSLHRNARSAGAGAATPLAGVF
jgi:phage protein D